MKVLIYFPFNEKMTGGPRSMLNLVKGLKKRNFSIKVVTQKRSELTEQMTTSSIDFDLIDTATILESSSGNLAQPGIFTVLQMIKAIFRFNFKVSKVLRNDDFDIIWVRNIKSFIQVLPVASFYRVPVVWDIGVEPRSSGLVYILHNLGLHFAARIVTQGPSVAPAIFGHRRYTRYKHKINYIFPPVGSSYEEVSSNTQCTDTRLINVVNKIVVVGTINDRKNQLIVIKALYVLRKEGHDLKFQMIGDGNEGYLEELRGLIRTYDLGNVVDIQTWSDDIIKVYNRADLLVISSRDEGLPTVLREAFHHGVPVLASDLPAIKDVISHGTNGFLFRNNDIDDLIYVLREIIKGRFDLNDVRRNARTFAQHNFNYNTWIKSYMKILTLLKAKGSE